MPEETVRSPIGTPRAVVRPSTMVNVTSWMQIEKRRSPGAAPESTMLVGPAPGESSGAVSEGTGMGEPRLVNGVAALAGRWVIPTTRRIRGITQGSIHLGGTTGGGSGGSEGLLAGSGMSPDSVTLAASSRTLIVSSDSAADVVFFPAGTAASELRLVLRGWKSGYAGPDDEEGCEVPTALSIASGHYCVVTTDASMRMQRATVVPWMIPATSSQSHSSQAIAVIALINAQIKARGLEATMPVLPIPSPI